MPKVSFTYRGKKVSYNYEGDDLEGSIIEVKAKVDSMLGGGGVQRIDKNAPPLMDPFGQIGSQPKPPKALPKRAQEKVVRQGVPLSMQIGAMLDPANGVPVKDRSEEPLIISEGAMSGKSGTVVGGRLYKQSGPGLSERFTMWLNQQAATDRETGGTWTREYIKSLNSRRRKGEKLEDVWARDQNKPQRTSMRAQTAGEAKSLEDNRKSHIIDPYVGVNWKETRKGLEEAGSKAARVPANIAAARTDLLGQELFGAPPGWFLYGEDTKGLRETQGRIVTNASAAIPGVGVTQAMGLASSASQLEREKGIGGAAKELGSGFIQSLNAFEPGIPADERVVRSLNMILVAGGLAHGGNVIKKAASSEVLARQVSSRIGVSMKEARTLVKQAKDFSLRTDASELSKPRTEQVRFGVEPTVSGGANYGEKMQAKAKTQVGPTLTNPKGKPFIQETGKRQFTGSAEDVSVKTGETNATEKGKIEEGNLGEHQNGDGTREATKTGGSDSTVSSKEAQKEVAITHEGSDELRKIYELEERKGTPKEEIDQWVKKAVADNEVSKARETAQKFLDGKGRGRISNSEQVGMAIRASELVKELDKYRGKKDEYSLSRSLAAEEELTTILDAADKAGTQWGKEGNARKVIVNTDTSPEMVKYRVKRAFEKSGVEVDQSVINRAGDASIELEAALKRIAELESKQGGRGSKKSPPADRRAAIIERIKQRANEFASQENKPKYVDGLGDTTGQIDLATNYTSEHLKYIAEQLKDASELVYTYIEEGAKTASEAIAMAAKHVPGVTERQIRDEFSGYGKTREPGSPSTASIMRREARLLSTLEDLKAGKEIPEVKRQKYQNTVIAELQRAIRELKKDKNTDAKKTANLEARTQRLKERLENANAGNVRERTPREEDPLSKLVKEVADAERLAEARAEFRKRSQQIKDKDWTVDWERGQKQVSKELLDLRQRTSNLRRYIKAMEASAGRGTSGFFGKVDAITRATQLMSITNRMADFVGNKSQLIERIVMSQQTSLVDRVMRAVAKTEGPNIPRIKASNLKAALDGLPKRIAEELTQQMKEGSPEFIAKYGIKSNAPGPLKYVERATGVTDVMAEDIAYRMYRDAFEKAGVDPVMADNLALEQARDVVLMSENLASKMIEQGFTAIRGKTGKEAADMIFHMAGGRFGKVIGNVMGVNTDYMFGGGIAKASGQAFLKFADSFRATEGKGLARVKNAINNMEWSYAERELFAKRLVRGGWGAAGTYAGYLMAEKGVIDMEQFEKDHPLLAKVIKSVPGFSQAVLVGAKLASEKKKGNVQGFRDTAYLAFKLGLYESVNHPYTRPVKDTLEMATGRKTPVDWAGETARRNLIPSELRWLAEVTDSEKEYNARKPKGFWEQLKMGIPKVREQVEKKSIL